MTAKAVDANRNGGEHWADFVDEPTSGNCVGQSHPSMVPGGLDSMRVP